MVTLLYMGEYCRTPCSSWHFLKKVFNFPVSVLDVNTDFHSRMPMNDEKASELLSVHGVFDNAVLVTPNSQYSSGDAT